MAFDTSVGKRSSKLRRQDRFWKYCCLILLIAAGLILYTVNLSSLTLSESEGTTAQIARQILSAPPNLTKWLFPPFLLNSEPVMRSPFLPDLVAFSYYLGGISPLTTRLPIALLGALSTGLLYGIGRELFKGTSAILCTCCVYTTLFPAISGGRIATVDTPLVFWSMFTFWAILRSRRSLRWSLISGLGIAFVGLTHTWSLLPLSIIILWFLAWDTPRLLRCPHFYYGLVLGMMPLIVWWIAQGKYYDTPLIFPDYKGYWASFLTNISGYKESLNGLNWFSASTTFPFYSLIFYICSPWFVIGFYGFRFAWYYRNWGWAKFILVGSITCGVFIIFNLISGLVAGESTNFYWYGLPFYPILALAAGIQLHQLRNLPSYINYPLTWSRIFGCSGIIVVLLGLYSNYVLKVDFNWLLLSIFASLALTLGIAAVLLKRKDIQFMNVLIWGSYISLLLFFGSQY